MKSTEQLTIRQVCLALGFLATGPLLAITPTTSVLSITPPGPVTARTVLVLKASVTASGNPVTRGLVVFCNAAATRCEDAAILGQAQLTAAGSATLKVLLGIGAHSMKALFQGTKLLAPSASIKESVTVSGKYPTTTAVSVSGQPGDFMASGTVIFPVPPAPTGALSFANRGAVVGTAPLTATTASRGFFDVSEPSVDGAFTGSVVADFNGDGIPDIASTFIGAGGLTVLIGNGDGTFTDKGPQTIEGRPFVASVADFNGDGISDLAVRVDNSDDTASHVAILLGIGDGTFTATNSTATPPQGISGIGDFNGDGIVDIVGDDSGSGTITVYLGAGDGTFTALASQAVGPLPGPIAIGDFNGDGVPDLAVVIYGNSTNESTVAILLGAGDGTFTEKSSFTGGVGPIAVGDFNGDGIADLAIPNADLFGNTDPGIILLGNGDGTFTVKSSPLFQEVSDIVTCDFNGDGVTDLVVASDEFGTLTLFSGKGDGTFQVFTTLSVIPFSPEVVSVADFNGDGLPDLAAGYAYPSFSGRLTIFLGGYTSTASEAAPLSGTSYQLVANYSGDSQYLASSSQPLAVPTASPVLVPKPGIYQWTQTVLITDPDRSALIYYTLDGTTPTTQSLQYENDLITVGWDATVKVIAVALAAPASPVVTGTYSIDRPFPAPTFSLPPGTYTPPQSIALTANPSYCNNAICLIYYTLDGTTPTTHSRRYTAPIALTAAGTITIKAIGTSHHFIPSPVASATYKLN